MPEFSTNLKIIKPVLRIISGVWWCSMPYHERITYSDFVENKQIIESKWDKEFGDRLNELVFIGQDIDKNEVYSSDILMVL